MDIDAEREKLRREIEELERSLGPNIPSNESQISSSSSELVSDIEDDLDDDDDDSDTHDNMEVDLDGEEGVGSEVDIHLPQSLETCLHMNMVYQEVIQEKIEEITLWLAQNREQQEKLTWELAGTRGTKSSDSKTLPANMFLGHFMKPYFKDMTSGFGPPANSDTREKARQGIKSFAELLTIKWKSQEKLLLRQSVVSDQLQHLLQPKLLKVDYLSEKREKLKDEMGRQILLKQIQETTQEIEDINQLPDESLLGNRLDEHDWEKIANINFEGTRNAKELRKYWQNFEHPSISKREWNEEEVEKMKEIATRRNCQDWEAIALELGTQRTAFQCLQTFQAFNKELKKSEWSPEEDEILLQLVQEMRVGKHIPYRKIAYFMEGRDSAQLIYRWTKRVDPNLKRGAWTPEEDAMLLKAVAKYGAQDWYKIRMEVPGRNDIQCRDRYLHALHCEIKKGKWSEEEEVKLIELTEKYGVGHWAKVASELPHRSGTQCLSKWKVLLGYRKRRRKPKQEGSSHRKPRQPSLYLSSSEDSDLELDLEEEEEESVKEEAARTRKAMAGGHWEVPSIDLWVPTRKGISSENLASVTLLSKGFNVHQKRRMSPRVLMAGEKEEQPQEAEASPPATAPPSVLPPALIGAKESLVEEGSKNPKRMKDSWRVSLAYVKYVLRRNSYELQRRNQEINRKKRFALTFQTHLAKSLAPASREGGQPQKGQKDGMWKTTLFRRLMVAVIPWAGSLVQDWAQRLKTEAARRSKVELISKQLQAACLTSTPLFTLFIQLLQIDIDGCMKVIHRRKTRQGELLKSAIREGEKTEQAPSAQDPKAQPRNVQVAVQNPSKKLIPLKAKEGLVPASSKRALSPRCPMSKPKTVSELLREKRLRKVPQLLLHPSVIIQQPVVPAGAQVASQLPYTRGSPLTALPPVHSVPSLGSQVKSPETGRGEDPPGNGGQDSGETATGTSTAAPLAHPAPTGQATHLPTSLNPAAIQGALCLPPVVLQQSPANTVPVALASPGVVSQPGASAVPGQQVLPITWVLTTQGLVPMTIVGIPNQGNQLPPTKEPPKNLDQAAEASSALMVPNAAGMAPVAFVPQKPHSVATCGNPQNHNGFQQSGLSPPLLPATSCSTAPPLPDVSLENAQPCPVHVKPAPLQNQVSRDSSHPATLGIVQDPVVQPHPAPLQKDKITPDYSFISLEEAAVTKEWAKGGSAMLQPSLPYMPAFLCSLKALSMLLLNKGALEHSVVSLVASREEGEGPGQPDRNTQLRAMVQQGLQDNPAYQLLRSRFLAAFTFPAALAALAPSRVTTTLSGRKWGKSSQEEDSCASLSLSEEEEEEGGETGAGSCGAAAGEPWEAVEEKEEAGIGSVELDQLSSPGIRRSSRLQKKQRQR
ncbi:snRNA-activating protein complex subunit 4 isoform X1 [Zootoca vivipara]|uniref:snRNA-activating protein complex subunit 4 isoform X1 n=1 Tax=Zootoca vivipara TaxID=8524 RepID=UPI00293BFB2A|nr:snRNA-activating protein complex subunit 4 isoform X1 [Zootoca vivipara]XP_034969053.2 snRNA-activating protein complex subunit 4 isoform X1 [Zootoca vivipara]XP_034969054.2 snRNA-activating protein complex subunit 4 isoform X1 [Zootoca vivipara]XP_034969055.2 snRNA-activating protein complex subunit 4 isoform X1 [Zootoca vivipara]